MNQRSSSQDELPRRLPWLLVFRVASATVLLGLALFADWRGLPIAKLSSVLYAVILGNYLAVIGLGLLLRWHTPATAVAGVYLVLALVSALVVVQATGVIDSTFTFLYLLVILDAAIIGGRTLAIAVAAACAVAYGGQLVLQMYTVLPAGRSIELPDWEFAGSGIANLSAFYLTAFLAGYLAELLRSARMDARRATADLASARILHASILEALPVGVLAIDSQHTIRAANPRAHEILGSHGDLVGTALPVFLRTAVSRYGILNIVNIDVAGRRRVLALIRSELRALRADDTLAPGVRAPEAATRVEIVVIEDRTELTQLEGRLATKERLASLGELASSIAHEIRNPLAAISGSLELLWSGDTDAPSAAPLRDIVLREIARLNRLVDEFLQFARPAPVERASVDVASLIREVCDVLRSDSALEGHTLNVRVPERLDAEVDPERFRQILWNLLRNAVEASPAQTPIEIELTVNAANQGGGIVLGIRDFGRGLAPEIRDHLFEPFRTTKSSGTGLGLAVVHRIVEKHGGSIELTDAPGGGVLARVVLPTREAELSA